MDYTKQALRPLIYRERKNIEEFDINNPKSLDAEMLDRIERSDVIKLEGANKYILDIFNNVYYITTLILMEKHPIHYLSKYVLIAEHTSSAYYDIHKRNTWYALFSAIIMGMVKNYLCLLDERYLERNNVFMEQYDGCVVNSGNASSARNYYRIYESFLLDNLKDYSIDRNAFKRRFIDFVAVGEAESLLYRNSSTWRSFTDDYDEEKITELFYFCNNEYSASFLADHIRREAEGYKQTETVEFINRLDMKKLFTVFPWDATLENKYAWLSHQHCLLQDRYNELKKKSESVLSSECEGVNEPDPEKIKLIEELADYKEKVQGLSREKAALFVLSMANAFGFNYTNKKKDLAPVANYLFGYGTASIAKRLCEGFSSSDSDELAKVFDVLSPSFSKMIRGKGEAVMNNEVTPEVTPLTSEVTPPEG